MHTTIESETDLGPSPTISRPYRTICTTMRGRLSACTDTLGTLQLHLQATRRPPMRAKLVSAWRSGPLRRCGAMLDALVRGLSLLGETVDRDEALQLSRRIDPRLYQRLTNYVLVSDGRYDDLAEQVRFKDETAAVRRVPLSGSWVVARTQSGNGNQPAGTPDRFSVKATFELVRRLGTWELWKRLETGRACNRRHEWVCAADVLHHEPQFAAELLLYAHLRNERGASAMLEECPVGLVTGERLQILRTALA